MLRLEHISVHAGNKKILSDVSAVFEAGKMNLIIGPNGSGKSTLIKAVGKQLAVSSGAIYYGSEILTEVSYARLSQFRAVLSQHTDVNFPLRVEDVVMMGRYPHYTSQPSALDKQAVREAMSFFAIDAFADRDYQTLSGGEKQRVHFARVLAQVWYPGKNQLRYLLLDEPLTFLDVNFQYQFMRQLQQLLKQEDFVVVGVVHDLNLAAQFADTITMLHKGHVLAAGKPSEVLTPDLIEAAFHIRPVRHLLEKSGSFYLSF